MDNFLLRYNKNIRFVLIDCETYNLNLSFEINRPWSIGSIKFIGNNIIEENEITIDWSKVAPHLKIGEAAARITRFNLQEHLKVAKQPEEVFNKLYNDMQEADYIMGHNFLRFDLYLLRGYCDYMGKDWKFIVPKIIDTKAIAQGIKMGVPYASKQGDFLEYQYRFANVHVRGIKTSLPTLTKEYGIQTDESKLHGALYDLTLNKLVWDKLKFQIEK